MPFRFDQATCVAVGTFNIYIIQPAWLSARGIIPKGAKVAILSKLEEPGFRFSSPEMRSRWTVGPNAIEISTKDPEENCGALLAKVLEHLPWTPLKGVGCNIFYKAPLTELAAVPATSGFEPPAPEGFTIEQRSLFVGLKRDDHLYNLQLSVMGASLDLDVNAHTDCNKGGSELGQKSLAKFFEHRKVSEELIANIFKVQVSYEKPDPPPASESNVVAT